MNITNVKKPMGRPTKRPSESKLAKLYQDHTATEIAYYYGVSKNVVYGWIKYYRKRRKENASQNSSEVKKHE